VEKYLRTRDVKLVPVGNSKGIRLPKKLLQKYGLADSLVLEETDQGILLRRKGDNRLSWEETYKTMAQEREGWDDFDVAVRDGLEDDDINAEEV
jgi:antitoxin MazE